MIQTKQTALNAFVGLMLTAGFLITEPLAQAQSNAQRNAETKTPTKNGSKTQAPNKVHPVAQVQMLAANNPLVFEPNRGQAPANVQWLARASRFIVGLTSDGAILEFRTEPRR